MQVSNDLDYFVGLGYDKQLTKQALRLANGNKNEAMNILKKTIETLTINNEDIQWRSKKDEDWLSYNDNHVLPKDLETRALVRSPVYALVTSFNISGKQTINNKFETTFSIHITLKDGRSWYINKTYNEFFQFYSTLPIGSTITLTNHFPIPNLFHKDESKRCKLLADWLRELVLNESCMSNEVLLDSLYSFIDADSHGGRVSTMKSQQIVLNKLSNSLPAFSINIKNVPLLHFNESMNITQLTNLLPVKYDPLQVLNNLQTNGLDKTEKQLMKDLSRDRLIINNKRILGSQITLDQLIQICKDIITSLLITHFNQTSIDPLLSLSIDRFIFNILEAGSRTESAYLSFETISKLIDISTSPVLIVPLSELASPIEIILSIKERENKRDVDAADMPNYSPPALPSTTNSPNISLQLPNHKEWCINCEIQTSVVFRTYNTETMDPIIQLQSIYKKSIFAMPTLRNGNITVESKQGKAVVAFVKDTRTTMKDW